MKYNETDLTAATKIMSYLRSLRIFAVAIVFFSLIYSGYKIYTGVSGMELYLILLFTGVILIGSLPAIYRLDHITANIYGLSSIIAGVIYLFSIIYYRGEQAGLFTAAGVIAGLVVTGKGVSVVFGRGSREIFSETNQKMVLFVQKQIQSLKKSDPHGRYIIHSNYTDDKGKRRDLGIKFIDDIACFLLGDNSTPFFFDRNNVYISVLEDNPDFLRVSITVHNHDWLEALFKTEDFRKYEKWKDL